MSQHAPFEILRRAPSPEAAHLLRTITGYRETKARDTKAGLLRQRETATLVVPLVISLGTPFRIALTREATEADRQPSFAAGLHAGPVDIRSDGGAECVQMDLTPLGAFRVLGQAVSEIAGRMVDVGDLFGREGRALRERLGATPAWGDRFDLIERFVLRRAVHEPSAGVAFACARLARAGGDLRVAHLAREIGWSRGHLAERFRREVGVPPKTFARMLRFGRACALARGSDGGKAEGWAGIAARAGYADQAHLAREFADLAGEAPTAWARRAAAWDARIAAALRSDAGW